MASGGHGTLLDTQPGATSRSGCVHATESRAYARILVRLLRNAFDQLEEQRRVWRRWKTSAETLRAEWMGGPRALPGRRGCHSRSAARRSKLLVEGRIGGDARRRRAWGAPVRLVNSVHWARCILRFPHERVERAVACLRALPENGLALVLARVAIGEGVASGHGEGVHGGVVLRVEVHAFIRTALCWVRLSFSTRIWYWTVRESRQR
ncbi:hypothetical protein GGX14DRAFT_469194, partial [Mycena pura]